MHATSSTCPCASAPWIGRGRGRPGERAPRRSLRPDTRSVGDDHVRHPFDTAPTFYLTGQPGGRATSSCARSSVTSATSSSLDPYVVRRPGTVPLTVNLADPVEEQTLHMINADQNRTPTFTMFAQSGLLLPDCQSVLRRCDLRERRVRVEPRRHPAGDREHVGRDGRAGRRPERRRLDDLDRSHDTSGRRCLSLVGLKDDYTDDGHVIVQALDRRALPRALQGSTIAQLEDAYKQVNAPVRGTSRRRR